MPVLLGIIAVSFASCMSTQTFANREFDGIYSSPSDRTYQESKNQINNDRIVRLGGKYFDKNTQAPQSFEQEIYQNDPIASVVDPYQNDYIQWGKYQGTEIDYGFNSYPYGFNFGFHSGFYFPNRLSSYFGFGFGYPRFGGFYNHGFYNPYFMNYYDFYAFNRFYNPYPYYGYTYPYSRFYGYGYGGSYYHGDNSIFVRPIPATRGKGMTSNVNSINLSGFSNNPRIIRRGSDVNMTNSTPSYWNSSDTNLRKRSINEVNTSNSQQRQAYDRNSIRNQRNQDRVIYRRSDVSTNRASDFNTSRSSNWSNSSSNTTSSPARSSGTGTRIRR